MPHAATTAAPPAPSVPCARPPAPRTRGSRATRLRVPAEIVLTARALVGAGRKLADAELEAVIEGLIDELDARAGDPDLEPDDDEA